MTQSASSPVIYQAIGLMSGTSLDGVDITCCTFTEDSNIWIYKILNATTIPYSNEWKGRLKSLSTATAAELTVTNYLYGEYLGRLAKDFTAAHGFAPDFIASHGHTIFHQPESKLCLQVGSGAALAAASGFPVICDFRSLDIALGGQGAPLVPAGDKLLFPQHTFCLNLGGIANISAEKNGERLAYDICVCNIALNFLAEELGHAYDAGGEIARSGKVNQPLLLTLNAAGYYTAPAPKSLGREWVEKWVLQPLAESGISVEDKLCTVCHHVAQQIAEAVKAGLQGTTTQKATLLATGGGAFNSFLIELIGFYLDRKVAIVLPDAEVINFKEALIFAFLGVLRWRKEVNCLK
ncbi:MAG: anhydro-N-acetylmuramic acid kinase, partial [Sphingobacteriales bacterium]